MALAAEKINIDKLSASYGVRRLTVNDAELLYELCAGNPLYYEYCPPMATRDNILEDLFALPPNITMDKKYFVGFFDADKLVAVMDLIDGYPDKDRASITKALVPKSSMNWRSTLKHAALVRFVWHGQREIRRQSIFG